MPLWFQCALRFGSQCLAFYCRNYLSSFTISSILTPSPFHSANKQTQISLQSDGIKWLLSLQMNSILERAVNIYSLLHNLWQSIPLTSPELFLYQPNSMASSFQMVSLSFKDVNYFLPEILPKPDLSAFWSQDSPIVLVLVILSLLNLNLLGSPHLFVVAL